MKRYENQTLERFYDRGSARVFQDLEFVRCNFYSSSISIASDPHLRSIVRHVRIQDCMVAASAIDNPIVEDVEVDGLLTGNSGNFLFQIFGAVFKHVVLKGKIGEIMFSEYAVPSGTKRQHEAFLAANAEYYRTVDWALDISEGEFSECDLRSVPAKLVRRDPETQVVVTRQSVLRGEWRDLDLSETYWPAAFQMFELGGRDDIVLVAPKRHRRFRQLLKGLHLLRKAGIALAD
jgi:hypothetical protein